MHESTHSNHSQSIPHLMKLSAYGHSDVGFIRETNEDSFLVSLEKGIFAVADGVGGLPYGSLASLLAVQYFDALVQSPDDCVTAR